jgi:methyl-accepting chemotaxis protein
VKERYKFSLKVKLVVFTTILAIITYTSSAFFIYVLSGKLQGMLHLSQETYVSLVLILGIVWSGILAFLAASFITRPILKVKEAATHAAKGNVGFLAKVGRSDDEVRALGLAFNSMLENIKTIIVNIDRNFDSTNDYVKDIKTAAEHASQQAHTISQTVNDISLGAESTTVAIQHTTQFIEEANQVASEVQNNAIQSQEL